MIGEVSEYELHHRARLAIKPGITGMWQVSGRSDITDFEEVVGLKKYIDSAQVMFLLFSAQIFYIIIKSIYVNLYKAQKKQHIYFIKLIIIIIIGFIFNVICYHIYELKESFAVGTLLSAICWYFLSLPDFKWLKYNIKEMLSDICYNTLGGVIGGIIYWIGWKLKCELPKKSPRNKF